MAAGGRTRWLLSRQSLGVAKLFVAWLVNLLSHVVLYMSELAMLSHEMSEVPDHPKDAGGAAGGCCRGRAWAWPSCLWRGWSTWRTRSRWCLRPRGPWSRLLQKCQHFASLFVAAAHVLFAVRDRLHAESAACHAHMQSRAVSWQKGPAFLL